jgi:hypothetical protein
LTLGLFDPPNFHNSFTIDITHEFVAALSFSTTEETLAEAFSKFGEVTEGDFCSELQCLLPY